MKIEDFTDGQIDLLKALVKEKCNIALYRNGQVRLRDVKHNPLRNLRMDTFENVKHLLIRVDGLFVIDPDKINSLPYQITK